MQAQHTIKSAHSLRAIELAASAHIAEAKLLLRRAAAETLDPIEIRSLRNLAGALQFLIEQLGRRTR